MIPTGRALVAAERVRKPSAIKTAIHISMRSTTQNRINRTFTNLMDIKEAYTIVKPNLRGDLNQMLRYHLLLTRNFNSLNRFSCKITSLFSKCLHPHLIPNYNFKAEFLSLMQKKISQRIIKTCLPLMLHFLGSKLIPQTPSLTLWK
jgi:hypothetical protein